LKLEVDALGESRRIVCKTFEAEMEINGQKVPLIFRPRNNSKNHSGVFENSQGTKSTPEKIELETH
jgi:hypothetical protein